MFTRPTVGLIVLLTLAAGFALPLGGCQAQRDLSMIRAEGNREYTRGQYSEALRAYEEFLERQPGQPQARYDVGRTLLAMGRAGEAREHLQIAHDLRPENNEYTAALAEALFQSGDEERLDALLREQTRRASTPEDHWRVAEFCRRAGRADEAETAFLAAARVDGGTTAEPQRRLAAFYRQIGDTEQETRRLRMTLYRAPGDVEASDRLRELGHVPGPSFALVPEEFSSGMP